MEEFDYSKIGNQKSKIRASFTRGLTNFLVVAACIALYFVLANISHIYAGLSLVVSTLAPVWYGCVFAYLLMPVVRKVEKFLTARFEKKAADKKKFQRRIRMAGILVAIMVLIFIIVLLFNLIIPELVRTIRRLIFILPRELNALVEKVQEIDTKSQLGIIAKTLVEKANEFLQQWLKTDLWTKLNTIMESLAEGLFSVVGTIFDMIIGVIIAAYILGSKERFTAGAKKLLFAIVPNEKANFILHLTRKSNQIFGGFISGKIIDSLIIGVLCFLGMSIFGFSESNTLLVSVIIGVTNVIPFFGPYIGAVPSVLLIALENPIQGLYFAIFVLLLQQLDGNYIGPKILGDSTGLSPFWVVVSILLFGGLFGFIGMLFGVPVFAVISYTVNLIVDDRLKRKKISTDPEKYVDLISIDDQGKMNQRIKGGTDDANKSAE